MAYMMAAPAWRAQEHYGVPNNSLELMGVVIQLASMLEQYAQAAAGFWGLAPGAWEGQQSVPQRHLIARHEAESHARSMGPVGHARGHRADAGCQVEADVIDTAGKVDSEVQQEADREQRERSVQCTVGVGACDAWRLVGTAAHEASLRDLVLSSKGCGESESDSASDRDDEDSDDVDEVESEATPVDGIGVDDHEQVHGSKKTGWGKSKQAEDDEEVLAEFKDLADVERAKAQRPKAEEDSNGDSDGSGAIGKQTFGVGMRAGDARSALQDRQVGGVRGQAGASGLLGEGKGLEQVSSVVVSGGSRGHEEPLRGAGGQAGKSGESVDKVKARFDVLFKETCSQFPDMSEEEVLDLIEAEARREYPAGWKVGRGRKGRGKRNKWQWR